MIDQRIFIFSNRQPLKNLRLLSRQQRHSVLIKSMHHKVHNRLTFLNCLKVNIEYIYNISYGWAYGFNCMNLQQQRPQLQVQQQPQQQRLKHQ